MNVCPPNWPTSDSMRDCMARIAVMTTMMEKTPTNTPSNVSAERSLCAASAPIAMRKLSRNSAMKTLRERRRADLVLFIPQGIDGVHSRGTPGGKKSGGQAGQKRYQQRQSDNRQRHAYRQHARDQKGE